MRYLMLMLFLSPPCIGVATVSAPLIQGETVVTQQSISHGFAPKKQGFLKRVAEKIMQKRMYRIAKKWTNKKEGDGKGLSIIGLIFGFLGAIFLVLAINTGIIALITAALFLGLSGMVLCQIGLDQAHAMDRSKRWVKALAYFGLGLNLLISIASGAVLFLVYAFG